MNRDGYETSWSGPGESITGNGPQEQGEEWTMDAIAGLVYRPAFYSSALASSGPKDTAAAFRARYIRHAKFCGEAVE